MFNISKSQTLIAATVILGTTSVFSSAAFANTTTGSVPVSGVVTSTLTLSTTPVAEATSLALDSAAANVQQTAKVADLVISTNSEQGYKLTITSATGTLIDNDGVGTAIAYTVGISADANAPSTFATPSGTGYNYTTSGANAPAAGDRDLYIRYTPAALQDPGTYSDTINLTVTDQ